MKARAWKLLRPADVVLIGIALAAAVVLCYLFFFSDSGRGETVAVITVEGVEYARLPLYQNQTIELENRGVALTIESKNGTAAVVSSGCPDQICVHAGRLSRPGDSAVCLPARVALTIEGEGMPDAVTY